MKFRILLSVMALGLFVSSADAGIWFTQYATMDRGTASAVTQVNLITGQSSVGRTFTNTIDAATGGTSVGDTRRIVVVGANSLGDTYVRSSLAPPPSVASFFNGDPVTMVFALEGTATTTAPGIASALFDSGRVGFFTAARDVNGDSTFDPFGPATWGATDATGLILNIPLAVFDLVNPGEAVFGGPIDGVPDPTGIFNLFASQMNVSDINANTATNTQGNFLFVENTTFTTPGGDLPDPNDDWMEVTGPSVAGSTGVEGLVTRSDQAIDLQQSLPGMTGFPGAGFDALNTIAVDLGGLGGNAAGGFATGIGGDGLGGDTGVATDYNILVGNPSGTGDLFASLGTTSAGLVESTVPEPTGVAIWGLVVCAGLGIAYRRRRS